MKRDPLPRVLGTGPVRGPVAASLPDGTPHPDPFLAGRGWQARGGIWVRREPAGEAAA